MASDRAKSRFPPGFGSIWLSVALDLVGFGIVLPILPLYAERFGATAVTATALITAFSAAQLVFSPIWGRVSDRIGRKPVLVLSMAGTAVASLITGLAGTVWVLFLGRIVDGISGASVSVAQAAVTDVARPEERAHLLGLIGAAFGVGFVAGPAIGALAALGGPHIPFFVAAAIAGANTIWAARRLPETHPDHSLHRDRDVAPAAVQRTETEGPGVPSLLAVTFVALTAFSGFEATFALFGNERLHLHLASTGVVFALVGLVIVIVEGGLVRPAVRAVGERRVLLFGLLSNAVGLALLSRTHSYAYLVPSLLLLTAGQGLVTPTLSAVLAGKVGAERRGGLFGVQQAVGGLARIVGPIAAGLAFEHIGVPVPYAAGAAAMLAATGLLAAVWRPAEPHVTVG